MKRLLPFAAILLSLFPTAQGNEARLVNLDLESFSPSHELQPAPATSLPLLVPTRIINSDGNKIVVEEAFATATTMLPGRSAVLYKKETGGSCYMEFGFQAPIQPHDGLWRLKTRLLFTGEKESGNFSITLRSKSSIVFYMQIGVGGQISLAQTGETSEALPLGKIYDITNAVELELLFDFHKAEVTVFTNGTPRGNPGKFDTTAPIDSLSLGMTGKNALRTVAIHELTFAQE